jgi:osmotically-inducible protein OsmY
LVPVTWRFGAFPAVCAAAVLAVACSTMTPRSSAQRAADEGLAEGVYAALNADPVHFYRHVDVRVEDGVADLSGYVWSAEAIYRAREIALQVPGVRRVVTSQLELQRDGTRNGRTR